ncbi:MAG: Calx-beta domain-containing protein, partial [Planctomycetota bacterium]
MKRQIVLLACSVIILSTASQVIAETLIADDLDNPQTGILAPVSWFMYAPNTKLGQIVVNEHTFLAFDYGRKPELINSTGGFVVELEVSDIYESGWAGISIGQETLPIEQCEIGLIIQSDRTTDKKDRFFSRGQGRDIDTEYIMGQKIRIVITTNDVGTTGADASANIYFGDTLIVSNFSFQWDRGPTYLCFNAKPRAYFDNIKVSQAEPAVEFASAYSAAKQSDSPVLIDVILNRPRAGWTYAVDYDIANGTAANGEDFILSSSSLTFEPGQTKKTIAIPIINNRIDEYDETIKLKLKNPKGDYLYIGPNKKHTHTIIGSKPLVTFDKASTRVRENAGKIEIPVSLSHTFSKNVTVNYEVTGGNAKKGADYKIGGSKLHFAPGQTTRNIVLKIIDDNDSENSLDETITLTLNNSKNARLGKTSRFRCGIIDNEPGIEFDGAVWIPMINKLSLKNGKPFLFINNAGQLEWQPTYGTQLTVKLPEKDLSDPGDIVEYKWLFKGEGTPGGSGMQNLLERWGSGDFRWGVFDSNG